MEAVEQFLQWVKESDNIVFFGGAAVINQDKFPNIFTNVAGRII